MFPKRKVVGQEERVSERVVKTFRSKNILREKIERITQCWYLLECGHSEKVSSHPKTPKTISCVECYFIENPT